MRYVRAKWQASQQEMAYRIYITDSLWAMGKNEHLTKRYYDLIHPVIEDNRSGDEVAVDVIARLGIRMT